MTKKILHIGDNDKFIPPFVELVRESFNFNKHTFILLSGMGKTKPYKNVQVYRRTSFQRFRYYLAALIKMHQADKVILHGLFDMIFFFMLFCMPWILKKCYWTILGGDLYVYQLSERNWKWKLREFFRRPVIKRIGYLVTYIKGDVELARKWYGAKGKYHECIMYPSNIYKELDMPTKIGSTINIQVGNSANPSNNHIEALKKLLPYKDNDICIYVPLSYGSQEHAKKVITQGKKWFGDKFIPLTEFMPFDHYLTFLGEIDIAIFNHERQQAMGNTIALLCLGKTVYIKRKTTQWQFFKEKDIEIGDVNHLENLNSLNTKNNMNKIKDYFSNENLKKQCEILFD